MRWLVPPLLLASCTWSLSAGAQLLRTDMNAAPAPIVSSRFALLRQGVPRAQQWVSARGTFLHRPLVLTVPSTDPDGRSASLVEGSLLMEISFGIAWKSGWDAGGSLGGHLASWGSGEKLVTGGDRTGLGVAGRDPRFELGHTFEAGPWVTRPFFAISVPAGGDARYSGSATATAAVGTTLEWKSTRWTVTGEWGFIALPSQPSDALPGSHQLRAGLGTQFQFSRRLDVGAEALIQPVVGRLQASPARQIPAEVGGVLGWSEDALRVQLAASAGLPLTAGDEPTRFTRSAGTPILRTLLQCRWSWETSAMRPRPRESSYQPEGQR